MSEENTKLRRYLLSGLPEKETEELDLQVISEQGMEEKLQVAEENLVEDYLEGLLSAEETKLFQSNFLVSDERRDLVEDLALLKKTAKIELAAGAVRTEPKKKPDNFFRSLKNLAALYIRPLPVAAAVLLAGVVILGIWQMFLTESRSPLEQEYAVLNQQDLGELSKFQDYSSISLTPGTFRNSEVTAKSTADKLTNIVFFRLVIPFEVKPDTVFKAAIQKDEKTIFTVKKLRVYQNSGGREVRLLLPKSVFTKGQYQIRLENSARSSEFLTFGFVIE